MHRKKIAETLGCYVVRHLAGVFMKSLITVLVVATFVVALGSVPRANAARRSTPNYDQSRMHRDTGGSWQCYPYCDGGTYEGRPVREWLILLQKSLRVLPRSDSLALTRFAVEASHDGAAQTRSAAAVLFISS